MTSFARNAVGDAERKTAKLRKADETPAVVVAAVALADTVDLHVAAMVRTHHNALAAALLFRKQSLDEANHVNLADQVAFRLAEDSGSLMLNVAEVAEIDALRELLEDCDLIVLDATAERARAERETDVG